MSLHRAGAAGARAPALVSRRSPALVVLVLVCCSSPRPGPGLVLRLSGQPAPGRGCLTSSGDPVPSNALVGLGGTLRLSVVRHDPDGSTSFVCDAIARVPQETPNLDLGDDPGPVFDVHAELFDSSRMRIASGALGGMRVGPDLPAALGLQLYLSGQWSCPQGRLATPRAFHSVTPLPSGELMLMGGMTAQLDKAAGGGPSIFRLVNTIEIFDPRTSRFRLLPIAPGLVLAGRAFHHAVVLDATSSTIRILVYGGVVAGQRRAALDAVPPGPTQFRFSPIGPTVAGGAELLVYDLASQVITPMPISGNDIGPAAFSGGIGLPGGLLSVGGETFPAGRESEGQKSNLTAVQELLLLTLAPAGQKMLATPQSKMIMPWVVAPSLTLLSPGSLLVLGADRSLAGADTPKVTPLALLLGGLPAAPQVTATFSPAGPATAFHTATLLGTADQQVLVTGGFVMEAVNPIQARQPAAAADAVRLYKLGAGGAPSLVSISPYGPPLACGNTALDHYRPAGFEAATATQSGKQVLITGGTPTFSAEVGGCHDCEKDDPGGIGVLCVLRQASFYDAASQRLLQGPALALGRMGHHQDRLPDGNILVTGGLSRSDAGSTPATAEAEVYNPRVKDEAAADPEDPIAPLLGKLHLQRRAEESIRPCSLVN